MFTFSVAGVAGRIRFSVPQKAVMLAGSRNSRLGGRCVSVFSVLLPVTGFRSLLAAPRGLIVEKVVPDNLPPKAALHRRTVWMTSRCSMLLLFP